MIIILTKKPKENIFDLKYYISEFKFLLKTKIKGVRGPLSVVKSLEKGLIELNVDFVINPKIKNISNGDELCILSGVETLNFGIRFKKNNPNCKIFAGPNIVVSPIENKNIIFNNLIDKIIVPSQWVKDLYEKYNDKNKIIEVWAAGVDLPKKISDGSGPGILFKKDIPENIFSKIKEYLDNKKINYKLIEYGKYNQNEYFELLEKASWMIYLQKSESQGMAILESWSYNVPTLIWNNRNYLDTLGGKDIEGQVSSPYSIETNSVLFDDENDFSEKFKYLIENLSKFKSRQYIEENYTDKISAQNFLNILK